MLAKTTLLFMRRDIQTSSCRLDIKTNNCGTINKEEDIEEEEEAIRVQEAIIVV
jgi:hypothetical protein